MQRRHEERRCVNWRCFGWQTGRGYRRGVRAWNVALFLTGSVQLDNDLPPIVADHRIVEAKATKRRQFCDGRIDANGFGS
jgi:hypothetical protein